MAQKYDKQHFFDQTNGGLRYILEIYPGAQGFEDKNKNFYLDDNDSTASGRLKEKHGVWYVYNYREDSKGRSAIDLCMHLHNLEFNEAIKWLYEHFKLVTPEGKTVVGAKWHQQQTEEEKDYYTVQLLEEHTKLDSFAPFLTPYTATEYNFFSVEYYEFVSDQKDANGNKTGNRILNRVAATEDYPIFCFKEDGWYKIYEPFAKKEYRFRFFGKKPAKFVFGMERILNNVDIEKIDYLLEKMEEYKGSTSQAAKDIRKELDDQLLPGVFIGSGGSDSLNVASLNNYTVWLNSETEQLEYKDYQLLRKISKGVYNIPDIDATGVKMGRKLGFEYLDMKTIWLPLNYADTKKKDFRDWIGSYKHLGYDAAKNAFEKLKKTALRFKWWQYNAKSRHGYTYDYVSLMYFLEHHGFYVYKINHKTAQKGKIEQIFIKLEGNKVREVHPSEIKVFIQDWLRENHVNLDVLNMVIGSQGVNDKQLLSLPRKELSFTVASKTEQLFFFQNQTVRITPQGIDIVRGEVPGYVWENKIIKHNIMLDKNPQFKIFKDQHGNWDIDILEKNNPFFNYLINGSRVHWRKELEEPFKNNEKAKEDYHAANRFNIAGPNLNDDERFEQKMHLMNKMYAFGYMLHSYKDEARPWSVIIVDNKIPDMAHESKGRSGKSLGIGKILENMKERVVLKGRDPRLTDNQFIYDEVTEETDTIFIDDAHYSLNFGFFFSEVTGSTKVNKKHGLQFEIPFKRSPKIVITSNFIPQNLDESTIGRMLMVIYSDYYHQASANNDYLETRKPTDDFNGRNLLTDSSSQEEWNMFYNFCLQCLQFYLTTTDKERIDAPDGNVQRRNLLQIMGDNFQEWATGYFGEHNLNLYIMRKEMQNDYKAFAGKFYKTSTHFKKSLKAYCEFNGWILNPKDKTLKDGTIKRWFPIPGTQGRNMEECFFIDTQVGQPIDSGTLAENQQQPQATPQPEQQGLFNNYGNDDDDVNTDGLDF